jgi:HK97 family phage portal protein
VKLFAPLALRYVMPASFYSSWGSGDRLLSQILGNRPATAGVHVDTTSAQSLSTVWACVGLVASTVAALPLLAYRRLPDGARERWPEHPAADLLTHAPNRYCNAVAFREAMMRCALLYGNAFCPVVRDGAGRPRELHLLAPTSVQILVDIDGVSYRVTRGDGQQEELDDYEMMHIVGHSFDGIHGLSVIDAARRSLGLGIALEEFGASFFANGSAPGGILSPKSHMTDPARETLRASLEHRHQGPDRAHQLLILPADFTFTKLAMPADEAQYIESMKLSTATIARWFGVPPSLVNAESGANSMRYSNAESESINFLTYGLQPWLRRLEAAYNRSLVSSLDRHREYLEHLVDGLLRADTTTRWAAYEKAIQLGVMTSDEVRERENLGPRSPEAA